MNVGAGSGTYTVVITGSSGSLTHSTATITINERDFTITASPNSVTAPQGGSATSTITITSQGWFNGNVALSSSFPYGNTNLSPPSVSLTSGGSATSTWTLSILCGTPTGNYRIDVTGSNGVQTHSATVTLTVTTGNLCNPGPGCVAYGTPILTDHGYVPVQDLKKGDIVMGYDLNQGKLIPLVLLTNKMSWESSLVSINNGGLVLTATDQPIYIKNSTYIGWVRDPKNLKVGESIFNAVQGKWVPITSLQFLQDRTRVFDIVTTSPNNFIANGYLLDFK